MSGILGGSSKVEKPKVAPSTPKISEAQQTVGQQQARRKKRAGVDENILTLGRSNAGGDDGGLSSMLGRAA